MLLVLVSEIAIARTVVEIPTPKGFERRSVVEGTYQEFLRDMPLKDNNEIRMWDGQLIPALSSTIAVVDMPLLFVEDLEQCADYAMRLWAEYLKSVDQLEALALYDFYGNKKPFSSSGKSFKSYLRWHMRYSNSFSIKLGAEDIEQHSELTIGDMIVQNDSEVSIGHVSVILDEAVNAAGDKVYLLGYSFMPAQELHIEKAGDEYGPNGWFTEDGLFNFARDAFGIFGWPVIKRFNKI